MFEYIYFSCKDPSTPKESLMEQFEEVDSRLQQKSYNVSFIL